MAFPTGWTRRAALTIESTLAPSTLTNFPVLLNADTLPAEMLVSGGGNAAQADGGDIRFSSDSAGSSQLACEVVKWDQTNTLAEIWVLVPSLSSVSDTTIYVWYKAGGSETQPAVTDTYGRNAVWADYAAVYHGGSLTDATGGGNDLTARGSPTSSAGATPWGGDAYEFNGSSQYLDRAAAIITGYPNTLSCWFDSDSATAQQFLFGCGYTGSDGSYEYLIARGDAAGDPVALTSRDGTTPITLDTTSGYSINTWHHVAGVTAGSTSRASLLNGASKGTSTTSGNLSASLNVTSIGRLSRASPTAYTDGHIAEARLRNEALSDDWLLAEYRNGSAPGTYVTEGTPEDVGGGGATFTPRMMLLGVGA